MAQTLFVNIGLMAGVLPDGTTHLRGRDMDRPAELADAWLLVDDFGLIADYGQMSELRPESVDVKWNVVDVKGGAVLPAFCDSHTHIVFAGSREGEFADKIRGLSYEEIAANGGGILNSADLLQATAEENLYRQAERRLRSLIEKGTGCIEIKSGYGLTTEAEMKMLRVIKRLAVCYPVAIRSTFLGAHAVGRAYAGRQQDYVDMVCAEMIPEVGRERLAEFVDVFCDKGFFTVEQTRQILRAASGWGMRPKIHANELANSGGVQVGVECGALSVDHLERMADEEVELLSRSETVATMLPSASFFLGMPYAPARKAVDSNAIVALASDFNPGSSPSGDMRFVMTLGCVKMKLTPREALAATTINGAYAMGCGDKYGSISRGKVANLIVTRPVPNLEYIPYAYTTPIIEAVYLRGARLSCQAR